MIRWISYPKSKRPPVIAQKIAAVFEGIASSIDSTSKDLNSNAVLELLSNGLLDIGFRVERGKRAEDRIDVPVLFGQNGKVGKAFQVDAYNSNEGVVLEVEAGRGVLNYQFLKDIFQACMMSDVKYAALAVRNIYKRSNDFDIVAKFLETLYVSNRLQLPLDGILLIGY